MARFIADVVNELDLSAIYAEYERKDGRALSAYHPLMLCAMGQKDFPAPKPALEINPDHDKDWVFTAKSGEHVELHVKYERGTGMRSPPADVRFYSAVNPTNYQISRQDQVLDILRNITTTPRTG